MTPSSIWTAALAALFQLLFAPACVLAADHGGVATGEGPAAGKAGIFGSPVILDRHQPTGRISNVYGGPGIDSNAEIATDAGGRWIAVWHSSETLGDRLGDDWDILYSVSEDGVAWTPPAAVNRNAEIDSGDDLSPSIATDEKGTWVVAWESSDSLGATTGRDRDLFVSRSADLGKTWSAPVTLNSNASKDWGDDRSVRLVTDAGGHWMAVWSSTDSLGSTVGGDSDILVALSTDNGATWTPQTPVNSNAASDSGFDTSPDIATDRAGNWLVTWSSGDSKGGMIGTDRDILLARSSDFGGSWSASTPLNSNAASDSNSDWSPRLATDRRGNWVAVWTSSDGLDDAIGVDRDVLTSRSADNGLTWSQTRALNHNAAVDSREDSSPDIAVDGKGNWMVIWHAWGGFTYDDGSDADVVAALSDDNGRTWSVPFDANRYARRDNVDDMLPAIAADGSGNWVAVWQSYHPSGPESEKSEWLIQGARGTVRTGGIANP
jgi:hypothetical protein